MVVGPRYRGHRDESADLVRARLRCSSASSSPRARRRSVDLKVFRRAADAMAAESQQHKVDDTKSMTNLTRQLIFGSSAVHGGYRDVPPHVHIPATAASH